MEHTIKVKAILRIAGIIALMAVVGFSFAACGDDGGNEGAILGQETLRIEDQQVWEEEDDYENNKVSYTKFEGSIEGFTGNYSIGTGEIVDGKFNYTQPAAPTAAQLGSLSLRERLDTWLGTKATLSDSEAKGIVIYNFTSGLDTLTRRNYSFDLFNNPVGY